MHNKLELSASKLYFDYPNIENSKVYEFAKVLHLL